MSVCTRIARALEFLQDTRRLIVSRVSLLVDDSDTGQKSRQLVPSYRNFKVSSEGI